MDAIKSDDIIRDILREKCEKLEVLLAGEVILIRAPMATGVDDAVRREIENLTSSGRNRNHLVVVLETNGGSIEVVERMSDVFRHHFDTVAFVVPNVAYSAGTVLCLSGDSIYMDYYSVLGPIDPQIQNREGRWVPGFGYLAKYNDLIEKSRRNELSGAELQFLISKFDPAELFALEQAKEHSSDLIERWLCEYKFKNWEERESSGEAVDDAYKLQRAKEIAEKLGDAKKWNSHGRGIPLSKLTSEDIKLKITNFGEDAELSKTIREYYDLFIDYCTKTGAEMAVHSKKRLVSLGG